MSQSLLETSLALPANHRQRFPDFCADSLPPGRWAVGVSGGADSVALLSLLRSRTDIHLHVAHLNHELRGPESDADAAFVAELAARWGLPCTIGLRSEVESAMTAKGGVAPSNPSARYRTARLALFAAVAAQHRLDGAILAHHADDQAETILHRLLRGSGWAGLCGMSPRSVIGGLVILRPLLSVRRGELREYLTTIGQPWREDSSNASGKYIRNRLRRVLADRPELTEELLRLADRCRALQRWVAEHAPRLGESFALEALADAPAILARSAAARWLAERGTGGAGGIGAAEGAGPRNGISPRTIAMLLEMARDAATPARQQVPGGLTIRRRRGRISAQTAAGWPKLFTAEDTEERGGKDRK